VREPRKNHHPRREAYPCINPARTRPCPRHCTEPTQAADVGQTRDVTYSLQPRITRNRANLAPQNKHAL